MRSRLGFQSCVVVVVLACATTLVGLAVQGASPASAGVVEQLSAEVPGTSNPWLAGQPDGATASVTDSAPGQSPVELDVSDHAGELIAFTVTGSVSYFPGPSGDGPDGHETEIIEHLLDADYQPENGVSDILAPVNAALGVFLDASAGSATSLSPETLEFETQLSRDYHQLAPVLDQTFFIGDGVTSAGAQQYVVIPSGAERLFLGPMDGYGWIDNIGSFSVDATIVTPDCAADPDGCEPPPECGDVGVARVDVGDSSVVEGNDGPDRLLKIPVTLSSPSSNEVDVQYVVHEGSAAVPSDFSAKVGVPKTLKFKPAAGGLTPTSKFVSVKVAPDVELEGDETFSVEVTSVSGGFAVGRSSGTGTIVDDDQDTGQFASVATSTVCEGDASPKGNGMVLAVTLAEPSSSEETVTLLVSGGTATSGSDFKAFKKPITVKFKANQVQKAVTVKVFADSVVEGPENLLVDVSGASVPTLGGHDTTTPVILDDD